MIRKVLAIIILPFILFLFIYCNSNNDDVTQKNKAAADSNLAYEKTDSAILYTEERHFSNLQQLTFGGDNAEAYFSIEINLKVQIVIRFTTALFQMKIESLIIRC